MLLRRISPRRPRPARSSSPAVAVVELPLAQDVSRAGGRPMVSILVGAWLRRQQERSQSWVSRLWVLACLGCGSVLPLRAARNSAWVSVRQASELHFACFAAAVQ